MLFRSPYANLVLVMEPAEKGPPLKLGRRIRFHDGKYQTESKDEIAFIRRHPGFGSYVFADEAKEVS